MQGLVGSVVAAVDTGLALKRDPNVPIYVWDELGKGPGKLSGTLVGTLVDVFRRATRVKVLSQFQRDIRREDRAGNGSYPETLACQCLAVPTCRS